MDPTTSIVQRLDRVTVLTRRTQFEVVPADLIIPPTAQQTEPELLHDPNGAEIPRVDPGLDPAKAERVEPVLDESMARLGRETLTPIGPREVEGDQCFVWHDLVGRVAKWVQSAAPDVFTGCFMHRRQESHRFSSEPGVAEPALQLCTRTDGLRVPILRVRFHGAVRIEVAWLVIAKQQAAGLEANHRTNLRPG